MTMRSRIATELYEAARRLGADSELLRIIGSYGDTMTDEEVLEALKLWNRGHPIEQPPEGIER